MRITIVLLKNAVARAAELNLHLWCEDREDHGKTEVSLQTNQSGFSS